MSVQINPKGLYQPQISHAQTLLNSLLTHNIAWDASAVGTGKTYSAAAISRELKHKPLVVICPKIIIPVWERILSLFDNKADIIINYEKLCRGNTKWLKYNKKIGPVRFLQADIKLPKDAFIILDESHKCKGMTSLNSGLLIGLKRQNFTTLLLSATQATNPLDMRSFAYAMNLIKSVEMKEFKQFCLDAGAEKLDNYGAIKFDASKQESTIKMQQIHNWLFDKQKMASRLTPDDMGGLIPENNVIIETYNTGVGDKIQSIYDEMQQEISKLEEKCSNYKEHILAMLIKARRKCELLKTPALVEMTNDLLEKGKSVVIFCNFTDTIEAITSRLKSNKKTSEFVGNIYGNQSVDERNKDIDLFQNNKKRILVCNIKVGGNSIGLHDLNGNYPRESIINPGFSTIDILQSMGRIPRTEGKSKCVQRIFYAAGTCEVSCAEKARDRISNLIALNDGELIPYGEWGC